MDGPVTAAPTGTSSDGDYNGSEVVVRYLYTITTIPTTTIDSSRQINLFSFRKIKNFWWCVHVVFVHVRERLFVHACVFLHIRACKKGGLALGPAC